MDLNDFIRVIFKKLKIVVCFSSPRKVLTVKLRTWVPTSSFLLFSCIKQMHSFPTLQWGSCKHKKMAVSFNHSQPLHYLLCCNWKTHWPEFSQHSSLTLDVQINSTVASFLHQHSLSNYFLVCEQKNRENEETVCRK